MAGCWFSLVWPDWSASASPGAGAGAEWDGFAGWAAAAAAAVVVVVALLAEDLALA